MKRLFFIASMLLACDSYERVAPERVSDAPGQLSPCAFGGCSAWNDVSGTRIRVWYVAGSDGSKVRSGVLDEDLGVLVGASFYGNVSDGRYYPQNAPLVSKFLYADAGCESLLYEFQDAQPGCVTSVPAYVRKVGAPASCYAEPVYMPVGTSHAGDVYELSNLGQCAAYARLNGFSYYAIGEPLPRSAFVRVWLEGD